MRSLSGRFSALCAFFMAVAMVVGFSSRPAFASNPEEIEEEYGLNTGTLRGSAGVNITPLITEGKVGGQGTASYILSFSPLLSSTETQTLRGVVVRIPAKYNATFTLIGVGPSVSREQISDIRYVGIFNDEEYKLDIPMAVLPRKEYEAKAASGEVTNIPSFDEAKAIGEGSSSKVIAVQDFQGNDSGVDDPSSREYGISTSSKSPVAVRIDIPVENLGEGDTYIPISADQRWRCFSPGKTVGSEAELCHEITSWRPSAEKFKLPTTITPSDFDEHGLVTAAPACVPTRNMGSWSKVSTDAFDVRRVFRYGQAFRLPDNPAVQYRGVSELEDGCDIAAAIITTKGTKKFPTITHPEVEWERDDNVIDKGGNVDITPIDPPKYSDAANPPARMASFLVSMQFMYSNNRIQTSRGIVIDLPSWVKDATFTLVGTQSVKDGVHKPMDVKGYTLTTVPEKDWNVNDYGVAIPTYEEVVADQAAGINSRVAVVDAGIDSSGAIEGGSHRYRVGITDKIYSHDQPAVAAIRVDVPIPAGMEDEKYVPMRALVEARCFDDSGSLGSVDDGCQMLEEYQGTAYLPASKFIKPGDFDENGFYWGTCAVTRKSSKWSEISYDVTRPYFLYPRTFRLADNPDVTYGSASYKEDTCDQAVAIAQPVYKPQNTPSPTPTPTQEAPAPTASPSPEVTSTPTTSHTTKAKKAKKNKNLAFTGAANLPLIAASVALVVAGGGVLLLVRRRR